MPTRSACVITGTTPAQLAAAGVPERAGRLQHERRRIEPLIGPAEDGVAGPVAGRVIRPILADARSGCRGLPSAVAAFDAILRHDGFAGAHVPDVVVHLGEPPASKVLATWLAETGATQVRVHRHDTLIDPAHAVTLARSRHLEGPYEVSPHHPLLTSRHDSTLALQKAGHASLVDTPSGELYLAHLCGRPRGPHRRCTLGRETALQRVRFDADGWLTLDNNGHTRSPLFRPAVSMIWFQSARLVNAPL